MVRVDFFDPVLNKNDIITDSYKNLADVIDKAELYLKPGRLLLGGLEASKLES
jgi:hypothetical protein